MSGSQSRAGWTWLASLVAVFMVAIDTLVVTNALPVIRVDLGVGLEGLQWIVNAYTLTFAVFLLSASAVADRFGRRRLFVVGMVLFTGASAAVGMSHTIGELVAARTVQGLGASIVLPLTLTLLTSVVEPAKRGHAFGLWGAMVGLGVATGPVIGGTITQEWNWHWIFWINVPIGLLLLAVSGKIRESRGGVGRLDPLGVLLITLGLLGVTFGMVRGNDHGWTSPQVLLGLVGGGALCVAFVLWQRRAPSPMVPLGLFRNRGFSLAAVIAMVMPFGAFGSVFFGAQYLQTTLGYSPLAAGVRTLPWTAMPMLFAPISGIIIDKYRDGGRVMIFLGLTLQAIGIGWLASIETPTLGYTPQIVPFIFAGVGMGLFLPPIARLAIGYAPPNAEGIASGITNALRQLGTVFGVSVLGAVFAVYGSYADNKHFVAGIVAAHRVGSLVLAGGAILALALPKFAVAPHEEAVPEGALVAAPGVGG
jgi:EmrB/QacA subfamily drug resistance transporter